MGCPLAAAAFALTLHTALAETHDELNQTTPNTTTTSYMDDINIITHHSNLRKALDTIVAKLQRLGLQLNTSKTECWVNPAVLPPSPTHQGIKRTTRPTVLKTTAEPIPITPDAPSTLSPIAHEQAPEHQRLITKRAKTAARLQHLQTHGLPTHIAQALWRTATASDATFTARTIGLDAATANALDAFTVQLHEQWLSTTLSENENIQLFTSISKGGFGFTSASHMKDTALLASWQQVAPTILAHTGHTTMGDLLEELPATKRQLRIATNNVDPTLWESIAALTADTKVPKHQQKKLTSLMRDAHMVLRTNALDPRAISVHDSTCGVGASAWLHAPVQDITPLTDEQ